MEKKTRELDFYERKTPKYVFLFEAVLSTYLSQLDIYGRADMVTVVGII